MIGEGALLTAKGHRVLYPVFDNYSELGELEICIQNREMIEQADEVYVMWDGRSMGTVFDLGMAFALRKKVKVVYINPKSFRNLIHQMETKE